MKRAFWLLLLIGALLLAGCAGSGSYTASGYIFDDEGNPIEGVELVLSGVQAVRSPRTPGLLGD